MIRFLGISIIFLLLACSTGEITLTESGQKVGFLENPEELPQCKFQESIQTMVLLSAPNSYQQALNKLRNKAASMEATHVKLLRSVADEQTTTIHAMIYHCQSLEKSSSDDSSISRESWMIQTPTQ
ncbi:MAG: hypothetical protein HQM11_02600 [SAR324 cluster bacterium]|nr:hypothetical protein [SAR324 cluster bacterium]